MNKRSVRFLVLLMTTTEWNFYPSSMSSMHLLNQDEVRIYVTCRCYPRLSTEKPGSAIRTPRHRRIARVVPQPTSVNAANHQRVRVIDQHDLIAMIHTHIRERKVAV